MKKTILSFIGALMFAALFMMNLSFFNENQNSEDMNLNVEVTSASAKKKVFIGDSRNRIFGGCKSDTGSTCVIRV